MLVKIKCPKCQSEGTISLLDKDYQGPYRCWKCRELFIIALQDNELINCQPLTEEEFERIKQLESMKKKFRHE